MLAFAVRPEAENFTDAVLADAQGHVDGVILDHMAVSVADFDPKRVENDDWIHPFQRPGLPLPDFVQHGVSHAADQVWRYLQAIRPGPPCMCDVTKPRLSSAGPDRLP